MAQVASCCAYEMLKQEAVLQWKYPKLFDNWADTSLPHLLPLPKDLNELPKYSFLGREPWSSGYGRRLTFQRLWVWILSPYTGWTFFTLIYFKNCIVCLKRLKINKKMTGVGPFKKKFPNPVCDDFLLRVDCCRRLVSSWFISPNTKSSMEGKASAVGSSQCDQIGRNFATLATFLKSWANFVGSFSICQNCEHILAILLCYWAIFIVLNGQVLIIIWSHW